jgi:HK97 gp10 family phage protein
MAINVSIEVSHNNIPNVISAIGTEAGECVTKIARGVQDSAQNHAPVLTGALKAGITVQGGGGTTAVVSASSIDGGADREYAQYNEYGTRYMGAQPFMLPGYQDAKATTVPAAVAEYAAKIEAAA